VGSKAAHLPDLGRKDRKVREAEISTESLILLRTNAGGVLNTCKSSGVQLVARQGKT